jgi:hypothetical protein
MERSETVSETYRRATEEEPRLRGIEREIARGMADPAGACCGNCYWEREVRDRIAELVGWEREGRGWLCTGEAYEAVEDHLLRLLGVR